MTIRLATPADIAIVLAICAEARAFQRSRGFVQWRDGYPSAEVIEGDIAGCKGYVIELDGVPAGYCVIDLAGDPEYDRHPEIWATSCPYAVVHRLAFSHSARGKGLARKLFVEIERMIGDAGVSVIKVYTGLQNRRMHALMDATGFKLRGTFTFSWGERLAYEKVLDVE